MNVKEMNKRIKELSASDYARITQLVRDGYGAQGIHLETGVPIRLINAVFVAVQMSPCEVTACRG